jgi:predicted nucleic acid-binding protein
MRICIDSSVFVRGFLTQNDAIAAIFHLLDDGLNLVLPRLVANEVTRNLSSPSQVRQFYRIFQRGAAAMIVDEPIPDAFLKKYIALGLRAKGDAFIGAFAEWQQVDYLLSDNRHFLRDLATTAYTTLTPEAFLTCWPPPH